MGEEIKFGIGIKRNKKEWDCTGTSDNNRHEMKTMLNSVLFFYAFEVYPPPKTHRTHHFTTSLPSY